MDSVWDVFWVMLEFFLLFVYIWLFSTIFADIFRRSDIHGWGKAGWIILVIFIPLIGALIYPIARPKMTEQDRQMMEEAQARQKRMAGYSAAEEISKAQALKDSGAITEEEFQQLKRKAMI